MNQNAVRQIIIVGGGVTGWVAAAGIANALQGQQIGIRVIETPGQDTAAAEPALPIALAFNQRLGIDERALMRETSAAFTLGTQFVGWPSPGHDYFQPMNAHGASIEFVHFHNFAIKARQAGTTTPFNEYSLCAVAAQNGRFSHPVNDRNSILSTLIYAHHYDAGELAAFMKRHALANGVSAVAGRLTSTSTDPDSGFISGLTLDTGETLEADLFVDCSGPDAQLIGNALGVDYEDWSQWLPANRMVSASAPGGNPAPCARITALDAGWHQVLPLRDRDVHRFVFNQSHTDDAAAVEALTAACPDLAGATPVFHDIRSGYRERMWAGNCIGLGAAAGQLEPMDGANLALLQAGLMRLISMFPDRRCNPLLAKEYNAVTRAEYQNIRDFQVLHYRYSTRVDQPFWAATLGSAPPDALEHKMRLFFEHAQVAFYEEESYPDTSWVSVWLGQDQWPRSYDAVLDNYDFARLRSRFDQMRQIIAQSTAAMPEHKAYLDRYCGIPG
jgi:tryptophan halogenase